MTYSKVVTWTPRPDVAKQLDDYCRDTKGIDDGQFHSMIHNPQDVVRDALLANNIITSPQHNCGDRSLWCVADPIRTTLWLENFSDLTQFSTQHGLNKQQVIAASVLDYINGER
jgi:hypothetical protein